jgi:hypothetical protein
MVEGVVERFRKGAPMRARIVWATEEVSDVLMRSWQCAGILTDAEELWGEGELLGEGHLGEARLVG